MMRRFLPIFVMFATGFVCAAQTNPAIPSDPEIEARIKEKISSMTLEEKVGQMCELAIDVFQERTNPFEGMDMQNPDPEALRGLLTKYGLDKEYRIGNSLPDKNTLMQIAMRIFSIESAKGFRLDTKKLRETVSTYKIGSILNAPSHALSAQEWQETISKIQEISMEELGIPCLYGLDQNHGTTYTAGGTLFPQPLSVAASFNTGIAYDAARITAYETRASDCPWTYNPTLDLGRDPRWSRIWENYGEDCLVNSLMGSAAVRGYQGDDPNRIGPENVAVSLKHYMGYGSPFSGKDRTPAYISPVDLREKHFAPFLAAIKAGALSVMVNSSSVNGIPVHANRELLTGWLKEGLNWDGMIVTDWADIDNLWKREKVAENQKDAIRIAINAGIDMSMVPYDVNFCTALIELVKEGRVPMSRIDDAASRVIRLKYRLGLFDNPDTYLKDYPDFGSAKHAETAMRSAEECMVLLKNKDGVLPLGKGKKILLAGPNANSMRCLNGGWSYTWQGSGAEMFSEPYNTIYEAFANKFGAENVIWEPGVTYNEKGAWHQENEPEIEKAVAAAGDADVIVACIGENSYCETPGNLTDLNLSANQKNLVKALAGTGKPVILILNEGRPRLIADIEPLADAIVDIILPGNYGGDALANLVAGDANFSGKLPFTYPKEINSLITYDYKVSEETEKMQGAYDYDAVVSVQWAFGYGLSYTSFEYSNFRADKSSFNADDSITFSVDVKNAGDRAGKESVLLFSSDLVASVVPDNRRLRAFEKAELNPGETKTVSMTIKASDLAFVGADGKWILEKGDFRMQAGNRILTIKCTETRKWETLDIL